MAITYPLALPSVGFKRIQMGGNAFVAEGRSPYTGTRETQQWGGNLWVATVEFVSMSKAESRAVKAWLLALNGRAGSFLMGDPDAAQPLGVATGTPVVSGAGQTGAALVTTGWTPSITGILKAGDYIQLGSGSASRLHQVLQNASSDGSGVATLDIWPPLRSSPANGAPVVISAPKGVFALAQNLNPWNSEDFVDLSISCVEVL